ncbi:MAG TPA: glycosyltransferase [Candidatus Kryptonia bacterium]
MRILFVTSAYPTDANPKTHINIKLQVESLRGMGIECDVCVLEGNGYIKYLTGVSQIKRQLRIRKYDVIHAFYMYVGWVARLSSSLPVVVTYVGSDVYGKCRADGSSVKLSRIVHVGLSKILSRLSSASIVQSARMASLVSKKSHVIPEGLDQRVFFKRASNREDLSLSPKTFYVLFAGTKSNGVKRYWLANKGVSLLREEYQNVSLIDIDGISQDRVSLYMNSVDCLLVTSSHEGGPHVVKEALACDLPVVSVDVGYAKERIDSADNCFIVEDTPRAIADALEQVYLSHRRSFDGHTKIQHLSLEATASRIARVYETITGLPSNHDRN